MPGLSGCLKTLIIRHHSLGHNNAPHKALNVHTAPLPTWGLASPIGPPRPDWLENPNGTHVADVYIKTRPSFYFFTADRGSHFRETKNLVGSDPAVRPTSPRANPALGRHPAADRGLCGAPILCILLLYILHIQLLFLCIFLAHVFFIFAVLAHIYHIFCAYF